MKERFYWGFKWLMQKCLNTYFSEVEIVGEEKVPKNGPFLLAANHQNAFLDALIVGAFVPRSMYYLTRSDVFTKKSKPFLELLHMMPIYRIRDGINNLDKNQAIFEACHELFRKDEGVLIFSEGNHGEHHYLRPLSKGTARLAVDAQRSLEEKTLKIVPCGINFFDHRRPRTKIYLVYGEPIDVKAFVSGGKESDAKTMNALKEELANRMKECLIIPEPSADYDTKVRKVLHVRNEGLSFKKLRELAAKDYSKDETQFVKESRPDWQTFLLKLTTFFNFGPLYVLRKILAKFEDKVFWGSMKFACMMILMPLWWMLGLTLGWILFGFWEGVVLVFLSVTGLFIRAEILKYD